MKRPLLTLVCCLALASILSLPLSAAAALEYVAARPPGTTRVLEGGLSGSRGLVVVLHGGSWSPADSEELARRALNDLSSDARRVGLRLLVPLLPDDVSAWEQRASRAEDVVPWLRAPAEALVLSLVERELEAGRGHPQRVYLAGHGAGATAAIHLAARHPGRFAAVAAWSGTPTPLWDEHQDVVGLWEDPVPALGSVPVYLWTGRDDEVIDREALEAFVGQMERLRDRVQAAPFTWVEGSGGHGYGPKGPRQGLRFLKQHRKRERP